MPCFLEEQTHTVVPVGGRLVRWPHWPVYNLVILKADPRQGIGAGGVPEGGSRKQEGGGGEVRAREGRSLRRGKGVYEPERLRPCGAGKPLPQNCPAGTGTLVPHLSVESHACLGLALGRVHLHFYFIHARSICPFLPGPDV